MITRFLGHPVCEYGIRNNRVDYVTLASTFDHILNNNIRKRTEKMQIGEWEIVNGSEHFFYNKKTRMYQKTPPESLNDDCFMFPVCAYREYIISSEGFLILSNYTDELVYYNEELNIYVWVITNSRLLYRNELTDIVLNEE